MRFFLIAVLLTALSGALSQLGYLASQCRSEARPLLRVVYVVVGFCLTGWAMALLAIHFP